MATGTIGSAGSKTYLNSGSYYSINCTMGANEYPTSVTFDVKGGGAYWYNQDVYGGADTYTLYLSNSNGSIKYTLGTITLNNQNSNITAKTFTVDCPNLYNQALYISGNGSSNYFQLRNQCSITVNTTTHHTNCTAPTAVNVSRSRSVCTVSWSGMSNGTRNAISSYKVIVNTSASETNATTVTNSTTATSLTSQPNGTSPTASRTYYFGVRSQAPFNNSGYKWSGAVTVPAKPSVSAGEVISESKMDALRVWINGSQTDVAKNAIAYASHGNTYRSGLTAGSTAFDDAWYNAASTG